MRYTDKEVTIIVKEGLVQEVYGTDKDIKIRLIDLDETDPENLALLEDEANCVRAEWYDIWNTTPPNPCVIETTFSSYWDGGTKIETLCKVNLITKEVFDIQKVETEGLKNLEGQQIDIDNMLYEVFPKEEAEEGEFWYE